MSPPKALPETSLQQDIRSFSDIIEPTVAYNLEYFKIVFVLTARGETGNCLYHPELLHED